MADHQPTAGEEIANVVTHGLTLLAAVAAIPVLAVAAAGRGDVWGVVGGVIFGATLVLLYGASTLYHAIPAGRHPRAKRLCRVLDHSAIYLLIAGTYTPFVLGPLRGGWGWSLFGTVWGLAAAGIALKTAIGFRFPHLSTAVYLLMGWLVVIAAGPLIDATSGAGLGWLVAGGLCYTGGVAFYVMERRRYMHAVWHVFVSAGSVCHFFAVLSGALGAGA